MLMLALLAPLFLADHIADAGDGPRPSPVQANWQLQFEFVSNPMRIEVSGQTYWYMLYRVTNPNPEAVHFFPFFTIVTEDLQVFTTDIGIPDNAFNEIARRHRPTFPHLMSPIRAIGDLRSGEDYARESVAIWKDANLTGNNFTVYVSGLSGETQMMRNPATHSKKTSDKFARAPQSTGATTDNSEKLVPLTIRMPDSSASAEALRTVEVSVRKGGAPNDRDHFTLRKTLEIRYTLPGSQIGKATAQPYRVETQWVMR